jgi:hypothetical protein
MLSTLGRAYNALEAKSILSQLIRNRGLIRPYQTTGPYKAARAWQRLDVFPK